MIVSKDKFIKDFIKWIRKKLEALPEEEFEGDMLKQALNLIVKHQKDLKDL